MSDETKTTGAWVITDVFSKHGIRITVKASGMDVSSAVDDLYKGIAHGLDTYGWTVEPAQAPQAPAPKGDIAAKLALEAGNPDLATELQAQAVEVPAAPDGKMWNIYPASFVKILPQPDNKVTIEFYGKDRKQPHNDYPELKVNKWDVAQAAGLMKHVTSADVSKAAEFSLNCFVYWLEGKEYTTKDGGKGHYKNVSHVR